MSVQNLGSQQIQIQYNSPWKAEEFNKRQNYINKEGIYNGGLLTFSSPNLTLLPFVAEFRTSGGQNIRVETTENIVFNQSNPVTPTNPLVLTPSKPYVTATYSWINSAGNYIDFVAKSEGELTNNTIIFGKGTFDISNNLVGFNYEKRTIGLKDTDNNVFANSIIIENKTTVSSGIIESGLVLTGDVESGQIVGYYNQQRIGIPFNFI
jgi:hypothetical protein